MADWDEEEEESVQGREGTAVSSSANGAGTTALPLRRFDDEEEEESAVKDSWDASDEEEEEAAAKAQAAKKVVLPPVRKKKDLGRIIAEREAKQLAELEELQRKLDAEAGKTDSERAAEELAEKMRQQKLVEDADLEVAKDLFGASKAAPVPAQNSLDAMSPVTAGEFAAFEAALVSKIAKLDHSKEYASFVESLCRDICTGMSSAEINRVVSTLNALSSEVSKRERSVQGKKGKKKKSVSTELVHADLVEGEYAQYEEYADFM